MAQKGLTIDIITKTATRLVEEKGCDNFSLRELATRLNVKAASLYNHVDGIAEIKTAVGLLAVEQLKQTLSEAADGKKRDGAVKAIAHAYRNFARENPELYKTIIGMPLSEDDTLVRAVLDSVEPIMNVMRLYTKDEKKAIHILRSFRSAMHGFVSLEAAGFFQHYDVNIDESYDLVIDGYIQILAMLGSD